MNIAGEVQVGPSSSGMTEGKNTDSLLNSLLLGDDSAPSTAQEQVAQAGGVPVEMQMGPAPTPETTPPAVREASAVASIEDTSSFEDSVEDMSMPDDILPKSARTQTPVQQQVQQPAQQTQTQLDTTLDEPMPDEVRRSAKRAQDAWTAAKREAKQYKKELEELKKQATTPQNTQEIDQLRKQLQEAEERIGQIDITNSSSFKRQYEAPINDIYRESVQELVKAGHDSEEAQQRIRALINPETTSEMMAEQLSDLPSLLQGVLYTQANKMRDMQSRRMQAIKDWRNTRSAVREEEQRQSEAIHQQLLVENVSNAIDTLRQEGSFLYAKSETDDNWNKAVETRIEAARGIMTGSPDVVAKYVADGVAAKTYRQLFLKERANVAKLRQDLQNLMGGRPIVGRDPSLGMTSQVADDRKPRNADSWLDDNL